jgi:oligopeptidase B
MIRTRPGYMIFLMAVCSLALVFMEACSKKRESYEAFTPPMAKKIPKSLSLHGHTRVDNYYWMRERDNPEIIPYLEEENNYAKKVMADTEDLQEKLIEEFLHSENQQNQPIPYRIGEYFYYERFEQGSEYPLYCRKKGSMEADEEIVLDADRLAEGHDVFALASLQISPGQDVLAFGVDTTGDRDYLTAWSNDNRTFFYVRDGNLYSHCLGTAISDDKSWIDDVSFFMKTKSNKYILIFSTRYPYDWKGYLDVDDPKGRIIQIMPSQQRISCGGLSHRGNKFYFCDDGRLMEFPVGSTNLDNEAEGVFSAGDAEVENFDLFRDYLAIWERKKGITNLRVVSLMDEREHSLDFGESIYSVSSGQPRAFAFRNINNSDFNSHILRFRYSSPTAPDSFYDYNMETRERTVVWPTEAGQDFDPDTYRTERLWATAEDGTEIPISLIYRQGINSKGARPLLLEGYGMYGVSEELRYNSEGLSLLDRGFAYAIAHVRGGGELPNWHKDGMLLEKKNSFTDFIACARYLVDKGYADPERLFAWGSSGGGLLMAGVITMDPELFNGVIIDVPFLDIITTMIDENQLDNVRELGNPLEKKYYEYMLSYAPYENVEVRAYPNILVTSGFEDTHVGNWTAAKFVAKLRAVKTDRNLILLKTYMKGGHDTSLGRLEQYRETALKYAFLLDLAGIRK